MPQVNIDLMFSIPGQSQATIGKARSRHAVSLEPDHISAYNLTYEEDTAFFESLRRGEMRDDEDLDASFFHLADDLLTSAGFDHYETSNYAQPGMRSTHNQGYWRGEDYLGLGPSAVSTIGGERWKNVADTAQYIARVACHRPRADRIRRHSTTRRRASNASRSACEPPRASRSHSWTRRTASGGHARERRPRPDHQRPPHPHPPRTRPRRSDRGGTRVRKTDRVFPVSLFP